MDDAHKKEHIPVIMGHIFIDESGIAHINQPKGGLNHTDSHGGIASIFLDFSPAGFALFMEFFQGRYDGDQQLEDNGSGDIGHDAEPKEAALA